MLGIVGQAVTLRKSDGSDKAYLLLRVVPVEQMKKIWIFPVSYQSAEVGLIAENGDYVVPSKSMRSETSRSGSATPKRSAT